MKFFLWLIFLLLLLWFSPIAEPAENTTVTWDYDDFTEDVAVGFEIELRPFRGTWTPAGVAFDVTYTFAPLPDGVYQAQVRAFDSNGIRSLYSNICTFTVPYKPPPPPKTHVMLTISGGPADIVLLDPIGRVAFYTLSDDGTPQVWKSVDQVNWSPFGPSGERGSYRIGSMLVTVTP